MHLAAVFLFCNVLYISSLGCCISESRLKTPYENKDTPFAEGDEGMNKNIILIGFMGSGKSSVGRFLSGKNDVKHIDTDWLIEKQQGRKISQIFSEDGEAVFREMETNCIRELLSRNRKYVISVGGGLPMRQVNREIHRFVAHDVDFHSKDASNFAERGMIESYYETVFIILWHPFIRAWGDFG